MNKRQQKIIWLAIIAIALMLLFPPFRYYLQHGTILNVGYAFILSPPARSGTVVAVVDIGLLLVQWLGVVLIAGALWWLAKDRE